MCLDLNANLPVEAEDLKDIGCGMKFSNHDRETFRFAWPHAKNVAATFLAAQDTAYSRLCNLGK